MSNKFNDIINEDRYEREQEGIESFDGITEYRKDGSKHTGIDWSKENLFEGIGREDLKQVKKRAKVVEDLLSSIIKISNEALRELNK